ncbi:unnamed protein product [Urochloa humidicola]
MAAASGSDGSGRRAGARAGAAPAPAPGAGSLLRLESLANPAFATTPGADIVVHLFNVRRAAAFADAALVLSARERSAADAEARARAAEEDAARLREEMAARALEAEAQIRRAAETEARLREEIRALEVRVHESEARAAGVRPPSDVSGRSRAAAASSELEAGEIEPELGPQDPVVPAAASEEVGGVNWWDRAVGSDDDVAGVEVEVEDGEVEAELGAQDPAAGFEEDGGADVDPDDTLTLNQYLQRPKQIRGGDECLSDEWENLKALAVVCQEEDEDDLTMPTPLEVIFPSPCNNDFSPNYDLEVEAQKRRKTDHVGDQGEAHNSTRDFPKAAASPISASSSADGNGWGTSHNESSSSAKHPKAAGGRNNGMSRSIMRPRGTEKPREKGYFYNMVLKSLKAKEREALAKASQQPDLTCWLYAPLPTESSVDVEEDPHRQAPQQ